MNMCATSLHIFHIFGSIIISVLVLWFNFLHSILAKCSWFFKNYIFFSFFLGYHSLSYDISLSFYTSCSTLHHYDICHNLWEFHSTGNNIPFIISTFLVINPFLYILFLPLSMKVSKSSTALAFLSYGSQSKAYFILLHWNIVYIK